MEYEAERIGKESTVSEIVKLVVNATSKKPHIARVADKVSAIFVPLIVIIAILAFAINMILGVGFNDSITKKIEIMTDLRDYYKDYLQRKSLECRESLANEIDNYLAQILTTNRNVSLSENFELKVTDEYGDEYKSEGQFAVVAFAYIMGILKTLKKFGEDKLPKEYPLVLDGPFSKLDRVQETGVLKYLPESAPQVIIFSKDDLSSFVPQNNFGTVCIIESNISKNMSKIVKANAEQVKYFFSEERANKLQNEKLKMKGYEN